VLLAVKTMSGESTEAWRSVIDDLIKRGLRRPEFLIVDRAAGLENAIAAVWGGVPLQRCTVHKHRNLLAHALERLHVEEWLLNSAGVPTRLMQQRAREVPVDPRRRPGGWRCDWSHPKGCLLAGNGPCGITRDYSTPHLERHTPPRRRKKYLRHPIGRPARNKAASRTIDRNKVDGCALRRQVGRPARNPPTANPSGRRRNPALFRPLWRRGPCFRGQRLLEILRAYWRRVHPGLWLFPGQDPSGHVSTRVSERMCK
jgi:hypothetical protein